MYLFFQGSNGETDWKNNLDFPVKAYKRMGKTVWFAHRGFLRVWKEIEFAVAKDILDAGVQEIYISGYSHGGAIATLCHEYAWYHRPDIRANVYGYGFGTPRVLWGVRSKALKARWEKFTVVRNLDDIVTHVPPAVLGYTHVGNMLEIGEKGRYTRIEAHYAQNILKELKRYEQK